MALTTLTTDLSNISKLDNYPPDDTGMTPALLKAKFDKAGNDIKTYINETLIPELEGGYISSIARTDGNGSAGTSDTYTITYQDASTDTFTVYNGADGATGAQGETGSTGETGATGAAGADGTDGAAATIAVGTVTTGVAGSSASVTNSGTAGEAVFDFSIPRGDKGDKGDTGEKGTTGDTGATGSAGTNGTNGTNGTDGEDGASAYVHIRWAQPLHPQLYLKPLTLISVLFLLLLLLRLPTTQAIRGSCIKVKRAIQEIGACRAKLV